jgi:kumamolisin
MKFPRSMRSKLFVAVAGAAAIALPLATASGAGASAPNPNAWTPVSGGVSASSLPHASVFGTTPADTPESVSFIMKANNLAALESVATHAQHSFDSVSQFAHTYGASSSAINALVSYLHGFGISTTVYADNLDIATTGTAGDYDAALSTSQSNYKVPRIAGHNGARAIPAQTVHANTRSPELPYRLSSSVLAVLGLTNYSPFTTHTAHIDTAVTQPKSGSTDACLALTGLTSACNLPSDYTSNYGLNPILKHANGSGQTAAIVTLASLDVGAPEYFWQNIAGVPNTGRTVTTQNIDGGSGAPSDAAGTGETDLDVEQAGGVAPGANIIVYQAPNTDNGFADGFFTAASQNVASTISSSWGESESIVAWAVASGEETPAYEAAFDEAFMEFAAQGQSGFVSAGDQGAYDAIDDLGTTNLAVDVSGDSPYITSSGGTTLPLSDTFATSDGSSVSISVSAQRAWGWDYLWPAVATLENESLEAAAESQIAGGGGGFSQFEATPSYQQGVLGTHLYSAVPYLTPTAYENVGGGLIEPTDWNFNPTPSVSHGVATGRAEPDVSADADPYSGYLLYEPSWAAVGQPTLQGGWGGTSYVAPQLNGSAAVIDSYLGHRVGFWNPAMYAAATDFNSPLSPLNTSGTSNDNLYYSGTPGTLYNPATGLGIPNLSALATHLASGH